MIELVAVDPYLLSDEGQNPSAACQSSSVVEAEELAADVAAAAVVAPSFSYGFGEGLIAKQVELVASRALVVLEGRGDPQEEQGVQLADAYRMIR